MKKTVITILLILPFVLIYFISFTGQILSKYTHIYVERIVVVDDNGDEYDEGDTIKLSKGEKYSLKIKVFPELASNKKVTISNSDKYVCSVDPETYEVVGLDYGKSTLIITSIDRHYIQYIIDIHVTDDDITELQTNKSEITVTRGKTEEILVTIIPETTPVEKRHLIWESADESIATVKDGVITGVNEGTTVITVKSEHKPSVNKEITVNVILGLSEGVFFDNDNYDKIYAVNSSEFDLKTITIVNIDGATIDDVWYELINIPTANAVDTSRLNEGIITFNKEKELAIISVSAIVYDEEAGEYKEYTPSKIKIWYVQA